MFVYYTCLSTTHVCLLNIFIYYTCLSIKNVFLLHIFVYYTCFSTTNFCLLHMFVYYICLFTTYVCLLHMLVYYILEMNIGCKFPNRLEWVLKSVPNRFEETSCARHANICVNAHIPFQKVPKYYEKCLEPVLGEIICID